MLNVVMRKCFFWLHSALLYEIIWIGGHVGGASKGLVMCCYVLWPGGKYPGDNKRYSTISEKVKSKRLENNSFSQTFLYYVFFVNVIKPLILSSHKCSDKTLY